MHIKQPLSDLLTNIEQEMERLHYTEGTLKFYRRRWKMLTDFAKMRGETEFSEQLGWSFIEHHFGLLEKDCARKLKTSEIQELRVIRMMVIFNFTMPFCAVATSLSKS